MPRHRPLGVAGHWRAARGVLERPRTEDSCGGHQANCHNAQQHDAPGYPRHAGRVIYPSTVWGNPHQKERGKDLKMFSRRAVAVVSAAAMIVSACSPAAAPAPTTAPAAPTAAPAAAAKPTTAAPPAAAPAASPAAAASPAPAASPAAAPKPTTAASPVAAAPATKAAGCTVGVSW